MAGSVAQRRFGRVVLRGSPFVGKHGATAAAPRLVLVRRGNLCTNPTYISGARKLSTVSAAGGNGGKDREGCVVVVTSGKGGVGKTTTAASLSYGLAQAGHRTCVIDFDIGLRNMDLHLGCERRVIFDFVNVIQEQCTLNQALIQDRRNPGLSLLAASQTKDKEALTQEGVTRVIRELQKSFDYVVCDSPAGIESGESKAVPLMRSGVLACLKSHCWYGHLFHAGVPSKRSAVFASLKPHCCCGH
ncbi:unnamed protein product [Ectocarpus sp. 4 AP-2014]